MRLFIKTCLMLLTHIVYWHHGIGMAFALQTDINNAPFPSFARQTEISNAPYIAAEDKKASESHTLLAAQSANKINTTALPSLTSSALHSAVVLEGGAAASNAKIVDTKITITLGQDVQTMSGKHATSKTVPHNNDSMLPARSGLTASHFNHIRPNDLNEISFAKLKRSLTPEQEFRHFRENFEKSIDSSLEIIFDLNNGQSCTKSTVLPMNATQLAPSFPSRFSRQSHSLLQSASTLNLYLGKCTSSEDHLNSYMIHSIAKSLLLTDNMFRSVTVVWDNPYREYTRKYVRDNKNQVEVQGSSANELWRAQWFKDIRDTDWLSEKNKVTCKPQGGITTCDFSAFITSQYLKLHGPVFTCDPKVSQGYWGLVYTMPIFGCNSSNSLLLRGAVSAEIDLTEVEINQCDDNPSAPFYNTHHCPPSTQCVYQRTGGIAFNAGNYVCKCRDAHYKPNIYNSTDYSQSDSFNGTEVDKAYFEWQMNTSNSYQNNFNCLPCATGCDNCFNDSTCFVEYDVIFRGITLGITCLCMIVAMLLAYSVVVLRKSKVMKASFWFLLEIIIFGALLLYSTMILQYFPPVKLTCLLIPWFREVGFSIFYGALVLKLYRVLAEFQSRKAHRVHVRDKDLLKWLFIIVCVVVGYMAAWTALNVDHIHDIQSSTGGTLTELGTTADGLMYSVCKDRWWDYLIELGEMLFLCFGIYLCYCIRCAPSDYYETRYISWAIYIETLMSAILHISRHILWTITHPDYLYLMYFIHCQLTVTVNLALVLGPKIYYAHCPPDDETFRRNAYTASDGGAGVPGQDSVCAESVKLHVGVNSNGDVDVGEVNLSEMDPEDIRTELRRLYTQLQIYKTKTMRKENPHISKRRGGRKHTNRKFSLTAFHHKHRHHHSHHSHQPSMSEVSCDHDTEMSRTPEESTNSAEAYGYSIDESTSMADTRTPTVTFKPGHKTIY